jgi:hypothetical protein
MTEESAPAEVKREPEEPAEPDAESRSQGNSRPFWRLDESDQRTLYLLVIGGLAANVGLVLVVGLGLLLAHELDRYHAGFLGLVDIASSVGSFAVAFAVVSMVFSKKHRLNKGFWVSTGIIILAVAVVLLAVIGYAAGIK